MNLSNEINVALVGCGGVVRNHRKAYAHLPGVRVVVTMDTDEAEARQVAIETNATTSSTNFADALAPEIDAVVISTPNFLHEEQAVAACEILPSALGKDIGDIAALMAAVMAQERESFHFKPVLRG